MMKPHLVLLGMSLIYLTGIEAAGKSTVCNELKKRGYEAHDIDQGVAHYYSIVTGKQAKPVAPSVISTEAWYNQHAYMMDRAKVEDYSRRARDRLIFLCGTTRNDYRVIDLFDKVIYLYLDENTLQQRLSTRGSSEFGGVEREREMILHWRQPTEDDYREYGATMVDVTQPIDRVVKQILDTVA